MVFGVAVLSMSEIHTVLVIMDECNTLYDRIDILTCIFETASAASLISDLAPNVVIRVEHFV